MLTIFLFADVHQQTQKLASILENSRFYNRVFFANMFWEVEELELRNLVESKSYIKSLNNLDFRDL